MSSRARCAYCRRRPAEDQYRPFCSNRCKQADLGRWLSGDYRIAGEPVSEMDPEDGDEPSNEPHGHHQ
jgi:uncharacterized protein